MSMNFEQTNAKQQWLALRLKDFKKPDSSSEITTQARPANPPLSFAQQRLWFFDQWEPGSTAYLLHNAWRLQGPLNLAALERSLTTLVTRHESLRTTFSVTDEHPIQHIAPVTPVSLHVLDLTTLSVSAKETDLERLLQETTQQPFNLSTGPLWQCQLFRMAPEEHVLLLTLHHIITDGWSMGILLNELTMLYQGQVTGSPVELAPLLVQYADFAVWQRQQLQGEVLDQQLAYWRTQLANAPSRLDLPTDFPRPPQQTFRGARLAFTLPPQLTQALKTLSQRERVTLFMTLLAAFHILLVRYTGQRDILVGTPIAGRTRTDLEGLIGFFVNTLVIRTQLNDQPTFRDVLQQVREACLEAYAHQDLPFEKLVEALQLARDPSRPPLFQVMFQLHQAELIGDLTLEKLDVSPLPQVNPTAKFDLSIGLVMRDQTLHGTVMFNTDLFEPATMRRLANHYQKLLEGLVENPQRAVSHIPLLTDTERHQLLIEWNESTRDYPRAKCMHELFEEQVERTPDTIAIVLNNQQLSYRDLNERANQLAYFLKAHGVGPEVPVAICLERGSELLISLLGILKAGGAYVPLDPTSPSNRLDMMLGDAQVCLVLTQTAHLPALPQTQTLLVPWETLGPQISGQSTTNPMVKVSSNNLAYLIYTSGSTGTPKGIAISHSALHNHMSWMQKTFAFTAEDRILQKTSMSFDASMWECWMPLLTGSRVVLAETEDSRDLSGLIQRIRQHQITHLQMVPSIFNLLLQEPDISQCHSLRHLFSGGEVLSSSLQQRCHQTLSASLHNLYGPTETTIDITSWTCPPTIPSSYVPIGRPIANTQIYLVDKFHQLVPIGVVGGILVGGAPLSRGYWNQPLLTAEQFQPNPFSHTPGERLFRTGDLARHHHDGSLEYLGRIDHQVKVRGVRIELGEIETWLRTHPAIQDGAVVCREDSPGKKQLVAYMVSVPETTLEPESLRAYLKTTLPDYMLPTAFVQLDTLPLTANGKVDRRALPPPDTTNRHFMPAATPPRTPQENILVEIWQDLLKVDQIGVHDNFFALGGHSLLATQVRARIKTRLQVDLPLRTFFEQATVASLAKAVEQAQQPLETGTAEEDLAALLNNIDVLSDEEAQALLEMETRENQEKDDHS